MSSNWSDSFRESLHNMKQSVIIQENFENSDAELKAKDRELTKKKKVSFANVKTPIRAINSTDDKWAPPASRDAFMKAFKNSKVENINIDAEVIGMSEIGHMNYFKPEAKKLWEETLAWLTNEKRATSITES